MSGFLTLGSLMFLMVAIVRRTGPARIRIARLFIYFTLTREAFDAGDKKQKVPPEVPPAGFCLIKYVLYFVW